MVTFYGWIPVLNCGVSSSSRHPHLELEYLGHLQCANTSFNMNQRSVRMLVESVSKTVKSFKKSEVECLVRLFHSVVGRAGEKIGSIGLDRNKFRGILHGVFGMTDDLLMNRVFYAFDKDHDNYISAKEWVIGLSVFLRGTFEDKLKFCFEVYHLKGDDGYISQEEIFDLLKNSLHQQSSEEETDEGIKELVDITLKKMDYDNDGKISFADFEKAVREDGLLLEVFGQCLPEAKNCHHFETLAFQSVLTSTF